MSQDQRIISAFKAVAGADADLFEMDGKAANTWLAYRSGLTNFLEWAEAEGIAAPLPSTPATVKAWLRYLHEEGRSLATVRAYYTAIRYLHNRLGQPLDHRLLAEALKVIARKSPRARKAQPLLAGELKAIVKVFDRARPADQRDAVILLLGWACALRQSEIAGLDWQKPGPKPAGGTGVLATVTGGFEVSLMVSKTAQASEATLTVRDSDMPSLRAWLERWAATIGLEPGQPVFRPVSQAGEVDAERLGSGAVSGIVRRAVHRQATATGSSESEAANRSVRYSGHSLRAGMITAAALKGVPEWRIRQRSRHRSAEVCAGYVRAAEGVRHSALKGVGF